jgi:hypothetical protein
MQYVHHMLLMECTSQDENDNPYGWEHLKVEPECTAMPKGCTKMKWAWAVGAEPGTFPEDTGLPFGGPSHRFIMLQVHYYNPTLDEGVVDSSGAKFSFTTELKAQEIGIMQLAGALLPEQHPPLPTGQDNLSISFATPSECTLNSWTSPLNIIGVGHHMHLYGTHQEINVVRDGVNLGAMRPEIRYDFQHQTFADTNPSLRQLLPGDQITQKCYFDTTNAPGDYVKIGEKTTDEMCYTVICKFFVNASKFDMFAYSFTNLIYYSLFRLLPSSV